MSNQPQEQVDQNTVTIRNCEPWELVDHFKVNRWMLKLGAEWTVSDKLKKSGGTGIGDQWELDGMIVTQKEAAKWYLATHPYRWWRFWL